MSYERSVPGVAGPSCRYGASTLPFRGPAVDRSAPHLVMIGSSEVVGRYVRSPMHAEVAEALGLPVANLGVQNAGLDAFVDDDALLADAGAATLAVLQVTSATNLSNRLYTVHPRRNDRVLSQSDRMRALFPEVDFSEFVFTRHMLIALRDRDPARFETVVAEMGTAWTARMHLVLRRLACPAVLLRIDGVGNDALGPDPLFVTDAMVEAAALHARGVVRVDVAGLADDDQLPEMAFEPAEIDAARAALPPVAHERVAAAVVRAVAPMLEGGAPRAGRRRMA